MILIIILAISYLFAFGGRIVGVILFLLIINLKIRNGFILDGSDNVIQVVFPFLILSDNLKRFRFFETNLIATNFSKLISSIFVFGIMIQVCFVYLFKALAKLQGELWLNGTAIYYTMRVKDFMATDWNIPLTENHYFVVLGTYFTIFWELAFPFLIWFRKTKYYILFFGVVLHVGIWIFMRIDNFSWVMISTYFVFISDEEYSNIYNKIFKNKLIIYIDGWCNNCLKFSKLVKKFDYFNLIEISNIRSEKLVDDRKLREMYSENLYKKNFYGFDSLFEVNKRLVVFWLFLPIMYLLKISKIGFLLYNELASKRKIIPLGCDDNCLIK